MRINHNIGALNAWRNLTKTNRALDKSLERLSSGLRINRAADDAAGLAISEKMRAQIHGLDAAVRNSQDGISLIQTAEGALEETHALLQRMRELAVQSSNDTLDSNDRALIQTEADELAEEVTRISNTTQFNGKGLLDGVGAASLTLQTGANADQTITVSIAAMDAFTLGIDDGGGAAATTGGDATVTGAIDISTDAATASTAITTIDTAIDTVSTTRSTLGASQNRLEHTINNLSTAQENLTAAESRVRDVDMAKEMTEFTRAQILSQSGTAMLAQANMRPQSVLSLLGG